MPLTEEEKRKMDEEADEAERLTKIELSPNLKILLDETNPNLEELIPVISDPEKYEQMIAEVEKSSAKNENIAQLKDRLVKIGLKSAEVTDVILKMMGG